MNHARTLAALFCFSSMLLSIWSASGQTIYRWTNDVGGSWTNAANWEGGVVASGANNVADFTSVYLAGETTVTLDGPRTIGQLHFGIGYGNDWSLAPGTGGPLTLDVTTGAPLIFVTNQQTATVGVALAGTRGLGKGGKGSLILTGTNTFTGNTTNYGGKVMLWGVTGRLADNSGVTFAGNSTFEYDNAGATNAISETIGSLFFIAGEATIKSTRTAAQTMALVTAYNNHTLGSAGNFIVEGGVNGTENKIVLTGRAAGLLSGRHAFNGTNFIWYDAAGFVRGFNYGVDANSVSVGAGLTVGAQHNKHVRITGSISAQTTATNATLNIAGPYDFTLDTGAVYTFVNGLIKAGGGSNTFSGGNAIGDINNELPIRVNDPFESLAISTKISGNFAVTKAGAGTLVLGNSANDFTNGVFVNNGTLKLGASNVIPDGPGKGAVALTGPQSDEYFQSVGYLFPALDLNGFDESINGLTGSGIVVNRAVTPSTLTVGGNDLSYTFNGSFEFGGPVALRKVGTGTLTITGTNFLKNTIVTAGTLAMGPSATPYQCTNFSVSGGATLDLRGFAGGFNIESFSSLRGNGTVMGGVTIKNGALLTVETSIGRFTFSSNLTLQGEVALRVSKSGATRTNDVIACAAAITFGGRLTVSASGDPLASGDAFKLFDAASLQGVFTNLNLPAIATNLAWSTDTLASDGMLRVIASNSVPAIITEPQDQLVQLCGTVNLTALASGAAPLYAQWYHDSVLLPGATNFVLTLTNISPALAGGYQLIVTNLEGSATSRVAVITAADSQAPAILNCPASKTLAVGVGGTVDAPDLAGSILATDCSLPLSITQEPVAGAPLSIGSTNITISVRDASNNLATCVVPITVQRFYGPVANAPDSSNYTLLCSLTLPNAANYNSTGVTYDIDHRRWVGNFSRVAYYLELQQSNGPVQFVWAAMDTFASNAYKLGIPCADTGAFFQQAVTSLDVRSSLPGMISGDALTGGNIQFWPGLTNAATGRGAMQVWHGPNLLFAINGWGNGSTLDIGIGNNTGNTNVDWTGMANAPSYTIKRLLVYVLPITNQPPVDADVVVYGGTSGGVAAAVQAARLGKRAVLLCFDNHIGGLSSGGLGATDTGNINSIGGISREFYRRIGQRYNLTERFQFEPHVAEQVFAQMLAEAGVPVFFNKRLASVTKPGTRITEIAMTDGSIYRGKMFVDTTYEGDLLAMAGVSFTIGRESTNMFNEPLNGIRPNTPAHQFVLDIDPYLSPGNPGSGLLPYIQPGTGGTPGHGDDRVQAYNFRLCLTQVATNRMAVLPPAGYDASQYELLGRYVQARVTAGHSLSVGSFVNPVTMPNGKTDVNNNGAFSTDFIGMNYDYPTNTYAARSASWKAHEDYIRGFLYFMGTDARVPASLRTSFQSWGLSVDEFLDTGGWPHSMYVREGRRMVSDYVMTQSNCNWTRIAFDSVGLASYNMDSHNCQRLVQGGFVRNEGDVQSAPAGPFSIAYRSIVPRASECENLFVTFALSGTHIAFSSCRMEPVFMITSQSAATAAAFAIDDNVAVQQVNYEKLALQLRADNQILTWGNTTATGIIVDDADAAGVTITGTWASSSATPGFWGSGYLQDLNADKGTKTVTFTPNLPSNGVYEVYLRWTENANRAPSVPVDIVHPAGTTTVFVNQQTNGGVWMKLLATNFNTGTGGAVTIRTDGTTGFVIADAVRFVVPGVEKPLVQVIVSVPQGSEAGGTPARFVIGRTIETNTSVAVTYAVTGTATSGSDYVALPGTVTLAPGVSSTNIYVTALPDAAFDPDETVTVTLQTSTNYDIGAFANATVTIADTSTPSQPNMLPPEWTPQGITINFGGGPGFTYRVERAPTVTGPWLIITNVVVGPSGTATWQDTNSPTGNAFYRTATTTVP